MNEKYSLKDFTHKKLVDVPASEFNNTVIKGSCFYQENQPRCKVFPGDITGVTFRRCNLDNVFIPPGNTVESSCTHKNIMVQNDMEDWELDSDLKPKAPILKKKFLRLGLSIDPKDIPANPVQESVVRTKKKELREADVISRRAE